MKIEEVYETEDIIPEDIRENFEQQVDGTYRLKLVSGLKTALYRERENVKSLRQERDNAVTERDALSEETRDAQETAKTAKKEAAATGALQAGRGNISLLLEKVMSRLDTDESGNVFVADASGTPVLNDEGKPQSIDELVAAMRDNPDFAGAFAGSGSAGGGTPPVDGGTRIQTGAGDSKIPGRRRDMSAEQKVAFLRDHDNNTDALLNIPW